MARSNSMVVMRLIMMFGAFRVHSAVAQTRHVRVVGGALGWTVPPNGDEFYILWASEQTFNVGDTLVFNFTNGVHNVAEVTQDAYDPCIKTNPISIFANGPAKLTLRTSGKHYYVCTVGTHCRIGQKLTINVAPRTTTSTAPATPLPTPPSSATTFTVVVPFIFVAAALALLFIS